MMIIKQRKVLLIYIRKKVSLSYNSSQSFVDMFNYHKHLQLAVACKPMINCTPNSLLI